MKRIFKNLILLFLILTFNCKVYAIEENTTPLTLKDCIQKALENSPVIKKQKIQYEMAKKNVKLAQSVYFPTLSASGGYNFSANSTDDSSMKSNAFDVRAGIKQLVWNFGKTSAQIKMEKFNKIAALYDFDTLVLDTILGVKLKYYDALASKLAIDIEKSNLKINERNYQRVNAFFEEGLKSKIDLVNSEVNVTSAKVNLIASENNYKINLSDLNNAMYLAYNPNYDLEMPKEFSGLRDYTPKDLTEGNKNLDDFLAPPKDIDDAKRVGHVETTDFASLYNFKKFNHTFEDCIKIANENRPDIKAYNATVDAMKQYLLIIKRAYYPEISLSGSYGFNGSKVEDISNKTNSFGVGATISSSVNVLNEKLNIDNAKLQVELAERDVELLKQNIYFEVQKAYIDMMIYEKELPLLAQKISHTLENLELADGRYAVGLGDYIELQDARMNYNIAQHTFIRAVFDYESSIANLERVIAMAPEVTIKLED